MLRACGFQDQVDNLNSVNKLFFIDQSLKKQDIKPETRNMECSKQVLLIINITEICFMFAK